LLFVPIVCLSDILDNKGMEPERDTTAWHCDRPAPKVLRE
jgi:hypothetical protein